MLAMYPEHKEEIDNAFEPLYKKYLGDLKNQVKQGQESARKLLGSMLSLFPDHRKEIDAASEPLYKKYLTDLRNQVEQGDVAAKTLRARMLAWFPERKAEIEAAFNVEQTTSAVNVSNAPSTASAVNTSDAPNTDSVVSTPSVQSTSSITVQTSTAPVKKTENVVSAYENYRNKRFCDREFQPFTILSNKDIPASEFHPNWIGALHESQSWTILIDETGSFGYSEGDINANGRIVGVVVPHNVALRPCRLHACEEKSFSKIETVIVELLNSRCGIMGLSSKLLGFPASDAWIALINELVKLAIITLPYDRKKTVAFDVKIERREGFDEKHDLRLLEGEIRDYFARIYPDFVTQRLQLKLEVVDKEYEFIGYPDAVANLWGGERFEDLLKYTGWVGSCLLDENYNSSLNDFYAEIGTSTYLSANKWEELVEASGVNAPSYVDSFLKNYGERGIPQQYWMNYLLQLNKYAVSCGDYYTLLRKIKWLEEYIPNNCKNLCRQYLLTFCYLVAHRIAEELEDNSELLLEFQNLGKRLSLK